MKSHTPIKTHFSREDWDIGTDHWFIDTAHYISPPTSIRYVGAFSDSSHQLCRYQPAICLPEGQLIYYTRTDHPVQHASPVFRATAPLGVASRANSYSIVQDATRGHVDFREMADGSIVRAWQHSAPTYSTHTWYHWRCTWFLQNGNLIVHLDRWDGTAWQPHCAPFTVTDPIHGDSPIQRCGLRTWAHDDIGIWIDDTEILTVPGPE